jgi:hypothetical protein
MLEIQNAYTLLLKQSDRIIHKRLYIHKETCINVINFSYLKAQTMGLWRYRYYESWKYLCQK